MAKDNDICPLILGGKFSSFDMELNTSDEQVTAVAPSSANCRGSRCHWWDGGNTRCLFKSWAINASAFYTAGIAYYEANTP